jgi:hypothetical protein
MSTISHERSHEPLWTTLLVREMWASLAITAMWIAVIVSAIWGPNIVGNDAGGSSTTIPSGVAVALFASLGTWAVAKYGFRSRPKDAD